MILKDKLINQILFLKKNFSLIGIKAEFEAEGSSHEDIFLLRSITNKTNTKLFVKIGGAEAINDIKFLIGINVDGIIAPMIESKFAAIKFINFFKNNKLNKKPSLTINIESKTAFENIYEIYSSVKDEIDNITIGRTDFSASYFNNNIYPNSSFITKKIIDIAKIFKKSKININIGGSIDKNTLKNFDENNFINNNIRRIETRKVILPAKKFIKNKKALDEALKFEELYILMKNELNDFKTRSDLSRLSILRTRK